MIPKRRTGRSNGLSLRWDNVASFVAGSLVTVFIMRTFFDGNVIISSYDLSSASFGASNERDFYNIALHHGTDKVQAVVNLPGCLRDGKSGCIAPLSKNKRCRPWGHVYHRVYQEWLAPTYTRDDSEPFQFLEIGFFTGKGYDSYREFMPRGEGHSIEISCLPQGAVGEEGKWGYTNTASQNVNYKRYIEQGFLHCGDASNLNFLNDIWTNKMNRIDAPPLKIVIDDGSHLATHMAQSVYFWLPRIQPGGLMIVEDIQPIKIANRFRTDFLPQIMNDLHYCGDPNAHDEEPCFPTLQPLLAGIHCEMHICVFERNDVEARTGHELRLEEDLLPDTALDKGTCNSLQSWGMGYSLRKPVAWQPRATSDTKIDFLALRNSSTAIAEGATAKPEGTG